jgi:osmoprotectant transport system substrate-binding protein
MIARLGRIGWAALLAVALAAPAAAQQVVVASKIDTEGALLGQMILQALQANGIAVTDKVSLGPTPVVRQAIVAGQIDIYPEYTGNGAFFFNQAADPVWKDAAAGYERVKGLDATVNRLVWLSPAPANNTWAIAVRADVATRDGLRTMSDLGRWVAGGGRVVLAASAEFVSSPGALPAFQTTYGFTLQPGQLVVLAGGDTAATIKAAAERINGTNAAMVYGTDGAIKPSGLVLLEDDKAVQQVYAPAPVVRAEVVGRHPTIPAILEPIFASLDLATLQDLNARIQLEGEPAKAVAQAHLRTLGVVR